MKRFAMTLAMILVLFSFGMAQAQITLNYLTRDAGCEVYLGDGTWTGWGDESTALGPYLMDLDVVEGDHHMRSVHDTEVILDGSTLTVTGSFLTVVSTDDQPSISYVGASANLAVNFTPTELLSVALEATVPVGGEVWFFDLTDGDYTFDNQGPGVFTLEDTLVPGHEYLFQVFNGVSIVSEGSLQKEESVTMSLMVAPDPVSTDEVAWGSVKVLFR